MNRFGEMNRGGSPSNRSHSQIAFPTDGGASGDVSPILISSRAPFHDVVASSSSAIANIFQPQLENGASNRSTNNLLSRNIYDVIAANRSNSIRHHHDISHPDGFSGGDLQNERISVNSNFSIFSSSSAREIDLEPIPIGVLRDPQHRAAIQSMVKESIHLLFGGGGEDAKRAASSSHISSHSKKRKRNSNEDGDRSWGDEDSKDDEKFRAYQAEQWDQRLEDLFEFRRIHGHCSVPYDYPPNPTLARWVKRQRYQYKLFHVGQNSAMTERRIEALEAVGFVWDTYSAAWERRISELRAYKLDNGHCNVPATYKANKKLAAWVKCQRRQYKLHQEGKPSTLTAERISTLNDMSFHWEMRSFR